MKIKKEQIFKSFDGMELKFQYRAMKIVPEYLEIEEKGRYSKDIITLFRQKNHHYFHLSPFIHALKSHLG